MKKTELFAIGFMLFAMFFGAGNLIFPVGLGYQSGENLLIAMLGFTITGVGLPLLSMIVGSSIKGGYFQALKKINPLFAIILLSANYLIIGPLFAIPRTATTTYELSIMPYLNDSDQWTLLVFSIVYFLIVLWLSLRNQSFVNYIGKILTPALLIALIIFLVRAFHIYGNNPSTSDMSKGYQVSPLATGFVAGYSTMDTLASLAFSIVVTTAFHQRGIKDQKKLLPLASKAALLAAVLLGIIYFALAWAGNHIALTQAVPANQNLGTFLLQTIAQETLGQWGVLILGIIVFLACLTTSCGLVVAISQFFYELYPRWSYATYVYINVLVSALLANQGLDTIINTSVPILSIIYPVTMALMVLIIFHHFYPLKQHQFLTPLLIVLVVSISAVVHRHKWLSLVFLTKLPFFDQQFEWLAVLPLALILGLILPISGPVVSFSAHDS